MSYNWHHRHHHHHHHNHHRLRDWINPVIRLPNVIIEPELPRLDNWHHHHHHQDHRHRDWINVTPVIRFPTVTVDPRPSGSFYGWMPPSHCRGTVQWIHGSGGQVPYGAVNAGVDKDGSEIFAGRAFHEGDLLPAKITPSHGCAYISWGGQEIRKHDYEVMVSSHVAWQFGSNGSVPVEAICCGHTNSGERLFMGRHMIDGTLTVGKVHPSHGCVYLPYNGREESFKEYEVLVLT